MHAIALKKSFVSFPRMIAPIRPGSRTLSASRSGTGFCGVRSQCEAGIQWGAEATPDFLPQHQAPKQDACRCGIGQESCHSEILLVRLRREEPNQAESVLFSSVPDIQRRVTLYEECYCFVRRTRALYQVEALIGLCRSIQRQRLRTIYDDMHGFVIL